MGTVLVVGASQGIGLETVKVALASGLNVRAFARSAEAIPITNPKLTKIVGDALKRDEIASAVKGADAVIQTLGVRSPAELLFGTTLFSKSARLLVDVMHDAGVRRLLMVTGAGAGNSRGRITFLYDNVIFPVILQRVYGDKDIAEDIVMKSGLDWTIARPGGLTNGSATGRYHVLNDMKDWRGGFISRADVAGYLINHIDDAASFGTTPLLIN